MHFQSHQHSKTVHSATRELHGEKVVIILNADVGKHGMVNVHGARVRAEDLMTALHTGMSKVKAGHAVQPVEFAEGDLLPCPFSNDWIGAHRGIYVRVHATDAVHAREKIGVMMRHAFPD
ncbi:MAG: hypothetical protein ACRYGG_18950 [Janthinobacterium lividum]